MNPLPIHTAQKTSAAIKRQVEIVRGTRKAVREVCYTVTEREATSHVFRRSFYVVQDIPWGTPRGWKYVGDGISPHSTIA